VTEVTEVTVIGEPIANSQQPIANSQQPTQRLSQGTKVFLVSKLQAWTLEAGILHFVLIHTTEKGLKPQTITKETDHLHSPKLDTSIHLKPTPCPSALAKGTGGTRDKGQGKSD